jgi:hypothetical protein
VKATPTRNTRLASVLLAGLFASLCPLVGCGITGGQALFMFGLYNRPSIDADFKLTKGPVAVLVDDFEELCFWPEARTMLAEALIEEFRDKKAATQLIAAAKVNRLRQVKSDFDERGCREIGRMLKADQVVWLEVTSFFASIDATEANRAARMGVTVKVINALEEEDRSKVRLWPDSPSGESFEIELGAGMVTRAKSRKAIIKLMCEEMAKEIALRFYDHKVGDFEIK